MKNIIKLICYSFAAWMMLSLPLFAIDNSEIKSLDDLSASCHAPRRGPPGPPGPQGPPGPAGPAGSITTFGSFFGVGQTFPAGGFYPFNMETIPPFGGITNTGGMFTITDPGYYLISYTVESPNAVLNVFNLADNGVGNGGTVTINDAALQTVSGTYILFLAAGDVVTLVNDSGPTLPDARASITFTKIHD